MILPEKRLAVACVIMSALGIILLYALGLSMQPPQVGLGDNMNALGGKAKMTGIVMSRTDYESYTVLKLAGTKTIKAVSFDSEKIRALNLTELDEVEVTGEFQQYKGENSLVITRILPLNKSLGCDCKGETSG